MSDTSNKSINLGPNTLSAAGTLTLGGTCVSAVMVTTMVLPAQTLGLAALGGGLLYAGSRKAAGKAIIPNFGKNDVQPEAASTPVETAAPAKAQATA